VHVYDKPEDIPQNLQENHYILDRVYPKIQIDLVLVQGKFTPDLIQNLSEQMKVNTSCMFIRCPGEKFPYNIGDFHGVRTIMN